MAGVSFKDFALSSATVLDFQSFGQVFPASMDAATLERLDNCARKARLPDVFSTQTELNDVRCLMFDYMKTRGFRRYFFDSFAQIIPAIADAVTERAKLDDLKQFDPQGHLRARLTNLVIA